MRSLYFVILRRKDHLTFIIAVVLSTIILFSGTTSEIQNLRIKVNRFFSFTRFPIIWMESKRALEGQNSELRERNIQLKLLLESMRHLEEENQQIRALLDFQRESHFTLVPATIHGKGITTTLSSFTIDVGYQDGIDINDPVVISEGVVGKTVLVGEHSSIVQLISDPDFRLSVRVVPYGAVGILSWSGNNKCDVREVPKSARINIGDLVYTSSYSDIYPPKLPVGKVTAIYDERGSFQKRLTVETFYNIGTLQYVFVIIENNVK
ncbi:MAG: rod shape-determining protein MreC [Candidatus Marinimicrobia bacterium]|nr:rod shape-determining protein MreC [Candidatus Neomarinimicrobiota bacterium]